MIHFSLAWYKDPDDLGVKATVRYRNWSRSLTQDGDNQPKTECVESEVQVQTNEAKVASCSALELPLASYSPYKSTEWGRMGCLKISYL
jgi:hypothetical protein